MRETKSLLVVVALLATVVAGCTAPEQDDDGRLRVVTTLFPWYEFAEAVGGDHVKATLLLPPGADAHTYEPRPSDLARIQDADVFIYTGAGMEPWALDLLEQAGDVTVVEASSFAALRKTDELQDGAFETESGGAAHTDGDYDPHIWLDFGNDQLIVDEFARVLAERDPSNEAVYLDNALRYKENLSALDVKYRTGLASCDRRELITNHEAFGYLAERYNLTVHSLYGVTTDKEPSPKKMQELTDIARSRNITYIFFERLVSPRVAEALAQEVGAQTLVLDPGHNAPGTQTQSFISIMDDNLAQLRIGLGCT